MASTTAQRAKRLSGLQIQVLSLYRKFLRATAKFDQEKRINMNSYIKQEFKRNLNLATNETFRIEYFLRHGYTKLELLQRNVSQLSFLVAKPQHPSSTQSNNENSEAKSWWLARSILMAIFFCRIFIVLDNRLPVT